MSGSRPFAWRGWRLPLAAAAAVIVVGVPATAGVRLARTSGATAGLTVLAASSLTSVLPKIDSKNRYSFGGSDTLAAQLRQGAPVDVYAAASPKYPQQLYHQGLVLKPVVFATNQLVLVTPASNPARIGNVAGLCRAGVRIVIGDQAVPIGSYTRQFLFRLGRQCALSNVMSNEQNVRDILTKVTLGEADAGFVYVTDARTVRRKVKTIFLPRRAQPTVKYEVAVLKSSSNRAAAVTFVKALLSTRGQKLLAAAGFGPPKGTVRK